MNVKWQVGLATVLIGAMGYPALAEDAATAKTETTASAAEEQPADPSAIRVEIHQTMAALIEARAAEEPNEERIAELSAKLVALRTELRQSVPGAGRGGRGAGRPCPMGPAARGTACPFGGPGAMQGMGPGAGRGRGPGAMQGMGPGAGRGRGPGAMQGMGPGAGRGRGPGAMQGMGPGAGRGRGPGAMQGMGPGAAQGRGAGQGNGARDGRGSGPGAGRGARQGYGPAR